jgi:hypothetical protein
MQPTDTGLKAWVATVDMGLGHQRAVHPLAPWAEGGILTLGGGEAAGPREAHMWKRLRGIYEGASRLKAIPLLGGPAFGLVDRLLAIPPYYPVRDLSRPTCQVAIMRGFIRRGLCRSLLERIAARPLPLVTSYPALAIAADGAGHEAVYCIVCDAEVSRAWVPADPKASRIHYLAPCERTVLRLRSYGVPPERVTLSGFPFPLELLGDRGLDALRRDFTRRLRRLEPRGNGEAGGPLTVSFAVGGAGAQCGLGRQILESLREPLRRGVVRLNLVAGVREEVRDFFERSIAEVLPGCSNVRVVSGRTKPEYFRQFSALIRGTDVLWTKPSELCFYSALGLPILVAPCIGSQEVLNRKWLLDTQAGIAQEDPRFAGEWLFDLRRDRRLAEAAWNGYRKVWKHGTFAILDLLAAAAGSRAPARLATA